MNKLKIMFVSLILLAFAIGVVSASITDYNAPIGFERNAMSFEKGDFEMEMDLYSSFVDHDDYFKSDDGRKVEIINGTFAKYIDSSDDEVGALELLKIDGDQYIVHCTFKDMDKNKADDCLKYLEEFNNVNKFKPIEIK